MITGRLRWVAPEDNGPTLPFERDRITTFVRALDDHGVEWESVLRVRGMVIGAVECAVTAEWVDTYPPLPVRTGTVISLLASQRAIAHLTVDDVVHEHVEDSL